MGEQLGPAVEAARRPNIVIQAIPPGAGAHEGLRGPFIVADFAGRAESGVAGRCGARAAHRGRRWYRGADGLVGYPQIGGVAQARLQALMEEVAKTWT